MEKTLEGMFKEFHDKLEISATEKLLPLDTKRIMKVTALHIDSVSKHFLEVYKIWLEANKNVENATNKDTAYLRMHLILEETAELMNAFVNHDELGAFDALCDLIYVTAGTAAVFNMPLSEGFEEVHRSNMTKEKQPTDSDAIRVREKGPNYEPPQLHRILLNHLAKQGLVPPLEFAGDVLEAVEVDQKEDQGE